MRELLQKKKNEKRVVKYVLRKYTVGVVSVAISTSLIAPVIAAASQVNNEDGIASILQEVDGKIDSLDKILETNSDISEEAIEENKEAFNEESTEEVLKEEAESHSLPTEDEINKMAAQAAADLSKVQYEDKDLFDFLQPSIRVLDELSVKEALKKEYNRIPTDKEVETAIRKLYMQKLGMEKSFNAVKDNLEETLKSLMKNSGYVTAEQVIQNKYKVLIGLSYLEKQFSFKFNGKAAKDIIFDKSARNIYNLIELGELTYSSLEYPRSIETFNWKLSTYVGRVDLFTFIEKSVNTYLPGKTADQWLKEESKAWIVEAESKSVNTSLYNKFKNDSNLRKHLIPLLAVSENGLYVISTMNTVNYGLLDTYIEDKSNFNKDEFRAELEKTAKRQEAFLEFWHRISKVSDKLTKNNNIVVVDSLLKYGKVSQMRDLWSADYGEKALPGVSEFIAPLGFYTQYLGADAQAGSNSVSLFLAKSLTDRGQAAYTHELTHILDKTVWFNGFGRRQGKGGEVFARGLFEIVDNYNPEAGYKPMFNLNLSYELGEKRVQNASPDRFQKEEDLQKYMEGLMDVIYTLDYAEAQSSLKRTDEEKVVLYNQIELTPDKSKAGIVNDTFKDITEETASKLNTIDDLVDNDIVSARFAYQSYATIGTAEDDGYYTVHLFDPIYAAMQNNNGAVGDITFRRNAYELLAQYGYSKGMVSYISNEYDNDELALKAILDSKYNGSLAEFKKDMFAIRASKVSNLKSTPHFSDFEDLQQKMDEAVAKDLELLKKNKENKDYDINRGVTAVNELKTKVLQWYLNETKDFEESIYRNITVGEYVEETEERTPIVVINEIDDSLWEDESRTVEGTEGVVKVTKVWRTENNVPVGDPTVTRETISKGTPTIVYKGTKKIDGEIVTVDDNVKIPVTIIEKKDPNLYIGETRREEGKDGIKKVTTIQKTKKDQPVGKAVVTEEVIKEMVPTVIYIGTKSIPQQEEVTTPDNKPDTNPDKDNNPSGSTNKPENSGGNINKPEGSDDNINNNIPSDINGSSSNNGTGLIVKESADSQSADTTVDVEEVEAVEEENEDELKDKNVLTASKEEDSKEGKKTSKAKPIAVAAGVAVAALAVVITKSVFEVKLLTILKKLFK